MQTQYENVRALIYMWWQRLCCYTQDSKRPRWKTGLSVLLTLYNSIWNPLPPQDPDLKTVDHQRFLKLSETDRLCGTAVFTFAFEHVQTTHEPLCRALKPSMFDGAVSRGLKSPDLWTLFTGRFYQIHLSVPVYSLPTAPNVWMHHTLKAAISCLM